MKKIVSESLPAVPVVEKPHLFQPGHGKIPGAGRPKGMVNHLTLTVKQAFEDAFIALQSDPDYCLEAWARKNPNGFYLLASKLIPTKIEAKVEDVTKINKMILPNGEVIEF